MNVLVPGHVYELAYFENSEYSQRLSFIHKQPSKDDPQGPLELVEDGTTNEEVLAVLIHRMKFQYSKFPSSETEKAITKLEEALMWLEKRTADRKARNVEGKQLP